jgi:hypothetical protein
MNWKYYKIKGYLFRANPKDSIETYFRFMQIWDRWSYADYTGTVILDQKPLTEEEAFLELI